MNHPMKFKFNGEILKREIDRQGDAVWHKNINSQFIGFVNYRWTNLNPEKRKPTYYGDKKYADFINSIESLLH